jgi:hypothetical protein
MVCSKQSCSFKITKKWKMEVHSQDCLPSRDAKTAKSVLLRKALKDSVKLDPSASVKSVGGMLALSNLFNPDQSQRSSTHPRYKAINRAIRAALQDEYGKYKESFTKVEICL